MCSAIGGFCVSWSLCLIFKPFTRLFLNGWCWFAHRLCVLEDSSIKCKSLSLLSTPFPSFFSCSLGLCFCYSPLFFLPSLFSSWFHPSLFPLLSHLFPCCHSVSIVFLPFLCWVSLSFPNIWDLSSCLSAPRGKPGLGRLIRFQYCDCCLCRAWRLDKIRTAVSSSRAQSEEGDGCRTGRHSGGAGGGAPGEKGEFRKDASESGTAKGELEDKMQLVTTTWLEAIKRENSLVTD